MSFPSDLEIARQATIRPLTEIADAAGIPLEHLEPYGDGAAKVKLDAIDAMADRPKARYVVVSAITPTPLGEGKTTTTVGLGQGFSHIGRKATIAIRQPSMGPTFGIKGGAAGGGYSQVVPMELFNLHLTGDMHAVTAAHNMCSAMLDAHLFHGNELDLDLHNITWRRVLDINERALRNITIGLGGRLDGIPRETGFDITAASEVMAALALCTSLQDLRERMGRIVVGYSKAGTPVTAEDLQVAGSMTVILREAIKPNLMQTLEGTPALVHCGPFGNIATGNSSIVADQIGIHTGDFLLTEAGFGADMGAERFFNIKCRTSGIAPDAAVLVATVRGLKAHSGNHKIVAGKPLPEALLAENPDEVHQGGDNLRKQLQNMQVHGPRSPPTSRSCTRTTCPCATRSAPWPTRSTAPTASTSRRPPTSRSTPTRPTASATCRSASPRPTSPSRRTRPSRVPRPAGPSRFGRSGPRSAPVSCTRSVATCAPCRASARRRAPPASTSTRTARSSA